MKDSHGWRIDPKKEGDSGSPRGTWVHLGRLWCWRLLWCCYFIFLSFSFPSHLAAAPCETGSPLQCFTDAFPVSGNAKDVGMKTGCFPIITQFEPMLLSKKLIHLHCRFFPCSVKNFVNNRQVVPLQIV